MSHSQKIILAVGTTAIVFMGLFPPWSYTLDYKSAKRTRPAGYSIIFAPPSPEQESPIYGVQIDTRRLLVQWIIVLAGTCGGTMLLKKRPHIQVGPE